MVPERDLLVADKFFFDLALFNFDPKMITAGSALHYLILDHFNLWLNRGDLGLEFVYFESVLFCFL